MFITQINWPVVGIALAGGLILLMRDWRITFSALLCNYIFIAIFMTQQQFIPPDLRVSSFAVSTSVLVKLLTGLASTSILAITALTFSREYNLEDLDEFSLAELRRAARRAQRLSANNPLHLGEYLVPLGSLVLALALSLALPRLYPIGPLEVDFAWYWLALTGLFSLVLATDLLKVVLGLMLCTSSIDVLYTSLAGTVQIFPLALLSLMTIVLALAVAYLSGLLYGRLKTLDLAELYQASRQ
jgi:hypothetical protein